MTIRSSTHRASLLVGLLGATLVLAGCDDAARADDGADVDGASTAHVEGEIHLEASADLFADEAVAARAEATAPGVSASLDVEAWGAATVDARVMPCGPVPARRPTCHRARSPGWISPAVRAG